MNNINKILVLMVTGIFIANAEPEKSSKDLFKDIAEMAKNASKTIEETAKKVTESISNQNRPAAKEAMKVAEEVRKAAEKIKEAVEQVRKATEKAINNEKEEVHALPIVMPGEGVPTEESKRTAPASPAYPTSSIPVSSAYPVSR